MQNTSGAAGERGKTDKVKDKLHDGKEAVQQKAASAAAEARHKGEDLLEEGKEKARELGEQAEEAARTKADRQMHRVAGGVRTFAEALRRGGNDLPEDDRQYQPLVNGVADRVENMSRYLEERDVDALTRDVRRFARDNTPLFLGAAFALGVVGARFLKSSSDAAREAEMDRYGGTAGFGGGYGNTGYRSPSSYEVGGYRNDMGAGTGRGGAAGYDSGTGYNASSTAPRPDRALPPEGGTDG